MNTSHTALSGMSYVQACHIFGNGDIHKGRDLIFYLAERLHIARQKHPWPEHAYGPYQALGVIGEEFHELEQAVLKESPERQKSEATDTAICCLRYIIGEHIVEEGG